MDDFAGAQRLKANFGLAAAEGGDRMRQIEDRCRLPGAHVEHPATVRGLVHRSQQGPYNVLDKYKIPSLRAIAKYVDRFTSAQSVAEYRDDPRVGGPRVLA